MARRKRKPNAAAAVLAGAEQNRRWQAREKVRISKRKTAPSATIQVQGGPSRTFEYGKDISAPTAKTRRLGGWKGRLATPEAIKSYGGMMEDAGAQRTIAAQEEHARQIGAALRGVAQVQQLEIDLAAERAARERQLGGELGTMGGGAPLTTETVGGEYARPAGGLGRATRTYGERASAAEKVSAAARQKLLDLQAQGPLKVATSPEEIQRVTGQFTPTGVEGPSGVATEDAASRYEQINKTVDQVAKQVAAESMKVGRQTLSYSQARQQAREEVLSSFSPDIVEEYNRTSDRLAAQKGKGTVMPAWQPPEVTPQDEALARQPLVQPQPGAAVLPSGPPISGAGRAALGGGAAIAANAQREAAAAAARTPQPGAAAPLAGEGVPAVTGAPVEAPARRQYTTRDAERAFTEIEAVKSASPEIQIETAKRLAEEFAGTNFADTPSGRYLQSFLKKTEGVERVAARKGYDEQTKFAIKSKDEEGLQAILDEAGKNLSPTMKAAKRMLAKGRLPWKDEDGTDLTRTAKEKVMADAKGFVVGTGGKMEEVMGAEGVERRKVWERRPATDFLTFTEYGKAGLDKDAAMSRMYKGSDTSPGLKKRYKQFTARQKQLGTEPEDIARLWYATLKSETPDLAEAWAEGDPVAREFAAEDAQKPIPVAELPPPTEGAVPLEQQPVESGVLPGEVPPTAGAPAAPAPMPASSAEAVVNQVYQFPDGRRGRWNGTGFEVIP